MYVSDQARLYVRYNSGLVQQRLKVFDGLLFREVKSELFLDLFVYIAMLDIGWR